MPYVGSLPKSGCSLVAPELSISAMYAAELVDTGRFEMSVFHALSDGSTAQPPTVGVAGGGGLCPPVAARVVRATPIAILAAKRAYTGVLLRSSPARVSVGPRRTWSGATNARRAG